MNNLYPLKFVPILLEKVWGGSNLTKILNKKNELKNKIGESLEISSLDKYISVVENGFLAQKNLKDLISFYKEELVGKKIYEKFGTFFPLLIKFIDASEYLSVQVHPNDDFAMAKCGEFGKTEMWYIIHNQTNAQLIAGVKNNITKEIFLKNLEDKKIAELINFETVEKEDVFFIPPGCLHGIGPGILLVEIQQTSDLTYRVYDWDRNGLDGKPRELHTDLAMEVLDFANNNSSKIFFEKKLNYESEIVANKYFVTNYLWFDKKLERNYYNLDSFIIYVCVEGNCEIETSGNQTINLNFGETLLVPAFIKNVNLVTKNVCKILEVYVKI